MPRDDLTVIYYTANIDNEAFEARIRRTLWRNLRGIPLISVSQKPLEFGKNICVGNVGPSYQNAFRQMQIGVQEAKTRYVCTAESDCLHPKEYFHFQPPTDDAFYVIMPLYVLFAQKGRAKYFAPKPRGSEGAMVVSRDYLLRALGDMLSGKGMWSEPYENPELKNFTWLLHHGKRASFQSSISAITIKTDWQLHPKTPHDTHTKLSELPYWGDAHALLRKYLR